ncbi:MAG: hypothetical protein V1855_03755 [bacterium]
MKKILNVLLLGVIVNFSSVCAMKKIKKKTIQDVKTLKKTFEQKFENLCSKIDAFGVDTKVESGNKFEIIRLAEELFTIAFCILQNSELPSSSDNSVSIALSLWINNNKICFSNEDGNRISTDYPRFFLWLKMQFASKVSELPDWAYQFVEEIQKPSSGEMFNDSFNNKDLVDTTCDCNIL